VRIDTLIIVQQIGNSPNPRIEGSFCLDLGEDFPNGQEHCEFVMRWELEQPLLERWIAGERHDGHISTSSTVRQASSVIWKPIYAKKGMERAHVNARDVKASFVEAANAGSAIVSEAPSEMRSGP
jgi:hypothetical protein